MNTAQTRIRALLEDAFLEAYADRLPEIRCEPYDWSQGNPNGYDLRECYWGPDDVEPLLNLLDDDTPFERRLLVFRIVAGIKEANQ